MKTGLIKMISVLGLLLAMNTTVWAVYLETAEYSDVLNEVKKQYSRYGSDQVLVVFDVDNTLLTSDQNFGTDQWFEWQSNLIKAGQFQQAVATNMEGLLRVQNMIYALEPMHETETKVSDVVSTIQDLGLSTIVLTARSTDTRDSTIRELKANGLNFRRTALAKDAGFPGEYLPQEDRFNKNPRPVSYQDGVMMVAGQHKGAMLQSLLEKAERSFKAIVFVDDKEKNTTNMQESFTDSDVDLTAIRYTRQDTVVAEFKASSKENEIAKWSLFSDMLSQIF